jgi:hypothetical protein
MKIHVPMFCLKAGKEPTVQEHILTLQYVAIVCIRNSDMFFFSEINFEAEERV